MTGKQRIEIWSVTPSSLFSFFSIRAAHEAHVIPPISSSTARSVSLTVSICAHSLSACRKTTARSL